LANTGSRSARPLNGNAIAAECARALKQGYTRGNNSNREWLGPALSVGSYEGRTKVHFLTHWHLSSLSEWCRTPLPPTSSARACSVRARTHPRPHASQCSSRLGIRSRSKSRSRINRERPISSPQPAPAGAPVAKGCLQCRAPAIEPTATSKVSIRSNKAALR
jgi:hypothetical protein